MGGGVGMNGGGGVGGGVNMSGGVGMGVCARSAFAEEEDGVVVEEEGGGKRWTGGCFGHLFFSLAQSKLSHMS